MAFAENGRTLVRSLFIGFVIIWVVSATWAQDSVQPADDEPIRVLTLLVNVPLIVSDKNGRFIGGLKQSDFKLQVDGQEQPIEYFADSESPISVAVVLDLSASVLPYLRDIREAAMAFVGQLKADDQATIVTFDQKRAIEVRTRLTADKKKLKNEIADIRYDTRGDYKNAHKLPIFPDMYDAIAGIMRTEFAGVKTRKAIIVLTDGIIVGQTISTKAFADMIVEGDALIYPVMFGANRNLFLPKKDQNSISIGDALEQKARQSLSTIASRTGGRLLIATRDTDFGTAFKTIGDELRKQYLIGFLPSPEAAKKGGRVSIALPDPTWSVRSKNLIRLKPR